MSLLNINNIFISDNKIKCNINKNGIKLLNGAYYDKFNIPYINNGIQFNIYNNNLQVDKLIDNNLNNIIIPDNSYYKNDDNLLTNKIISKVDLNLNSNKYIFINNTIDELFLSSDNEIHIILSIPLKNFIVSLNNIIIDYLIVREYHNNLFDDNIFNKFNPRNIINLTNNETILLFNNYNLASVYDIYHKIKEEDYFKYILFDNIPKLKNKYFYFKQNDNEKILTLDNYDLVISNINLKIDIDHYSKKLICYKQFDLSNYFEIDYSFDDINQVITFNHFALLKTIDGWYKYDFYNKNFSNKINENELIEIDNNIYSYDTFNNQIRLKNISNQQLKFIPLLNNSTLIKLIRCFNDIIAFCQLNNKIYIIFSSYALESFYYKNIINDYGNNFRFYFSYNDENLIIEYKNLNDDFIKLTFHSYKTSEYLMRI